jgi:hypothetical protein
MNENEHLHAFLEQNSPVIGRGRSGSDASFGSEFHRKTTVEQYLDDEVEEPKCILSPDCIFRMVWDLLVLVFTVYSGISVPFRVSFDVEMSAGWQVFEHIATCVFIVDIILNFNTAFYRAGNKVGNRRSIACEYLKFWFWLDLIASFPYDWVFMAIVDDYDDNDSTTKTP